MSNAERAALTELLHKCNDQKAEIKRLQALASAVQQANSDHCDEIERLRAALREISEQPGFYNSETDAMREIARKALDGP